MYYVLVYNVCFNVFKEIDVLICCLVFLLLFRVVLNIDYFLKLCIFDLKIKW